MSVPAANANNNDIMMKITDRYICQMLQKWLETWQIVRNKSSIGVLFHSLQRIEKKGRMKRNEIKRKDA